VIAAVRERERVAAVVPVLGVAVSCVWLVERPELRGVTHESAILVAGSALVAVVALLMPVPFGRETATLPRSLVLLVGLAAVIAAAVAAGRSVPVPASVFAPVLNILAAVAEEALFRRLVYGWLRGYGVPIAIGLSAVAFAVVHVPIYGLGALPVDLGAGLLLSWQRAASGTWGVSAATHAAANLVTVIV
jgi:membrane protease YdiL (CAAX protease family)